MQCKVSTRTLYALWHPVHKALEQSRLQEESTDLLALLRAQREDLKALYWKLHEGIPF